MLNLVHLEIKMNRLDFEVKGQGRDRTKYGQKRRTDRRQVVSSLNNHNIENVINSQISQLIVHVCN